MERFEATKEIKSKELDKVLDFLKDKVGLKTHLEKYNWPFILLNQFGHNLSLIMSRHPKIHEYVGKQRHDAYKQNTSTKASTVINAPLKKHTRTDSAIDCPPVLLACRTSNSLAATIFIARSM